jgi:hypothetical protein
LVTKKKTKTKAKDEKKEKTKKKKKPFSLDDHRLKSEKQELDPLRMIAH